MSSDDTTPDLQLFVGPREAKQHLVVVVRNGQEVHRDQFNTDVERNRRRWLQAIEIKTSSEEGSLSFLLDRLIEQVDESDQQSVVTTAQVGGSKSQADLVVELTEGNEFFHDGERTAYATLENNGHKETWPLRNKGFRQLLSSRFYRKYRKVPGSQAMQDAIAVLEGCAIFDGSKQDVFHRFAEVNGTVYVDLCNSQWQAVRITHHGWDVIDDVPVKFKRANGMLPLPIPEKGGTLSDLSTFLNVPAEDLPLLYGWMVCAAKFRGPFPILVLVGEHGTAKSTLTRSVRLLLDPNKSPLRSEPSNERDLAIAARNGWVLALDNLSYLRPWFSDALCRIATGGGFSARQLYSDDDEILFDAQRPIIINSIEELATRSDFLDRSVILTLERIPEDRRRTESSFWRDFEVARPRLLGALYSAVSLALRNYPTVQLSRLPRMADFATFAVAAEPAMNVPPGTFLNRYMGNQQSANALALEATPVALAIQNFIRRIPGQHWRGSATELYAQIEVSDSIRHQRNWPTSPRGLSANLRRIAPNLRNVGILVEFGHSGARWIEIRTEVEPPTPAGIGFPHPSSESGSPAEQNGQTPSGDQPVLISDAVDDADANSPQDSNPTSNLPDDDLWHQEIL